MFNDDVYLINFLRHCLFSIEKVIKILKCCYRKEPEITKMMIAGSSFSYYFCNVNVGSIVLYVGDCSFIDGFSRCSCE